MLPSFATAAGRVVEGMTSRHNVNGVLEFLRPVEESIARGGAPAAPASDEEPSSDRYVLTLTPYVSAEDAGAAERAFGYYYDGRADRGDVLPFTPRSLKASDDAFRRAVGSMASAYAEAASAAVFATIVNAEHAVGNPAVSLEAFDEAGDDFFFTCRSRAARSDLDKVRDEVRGGGDTWYCGEFGDVTATTAAALGFADAWEEAFAGVATSPDAVRLRLTLCDKAATLEPE